MDPNRRIAVVVGLLFIIATVAALVSTQLTASTTASDYLVRVSANANEVKAGVLFELAAAGAVALIPAFLFPLLRRCHEGAALAYLALRILEAFVMVVGAATSLLLVTLSQNFVSASNPSDPSFQTTGALLQGMANWTFALDPVIFGAGALLLYSLLYRALLVPPWLSLWGFGGAALVMAAGLIGMFGSFPFALAVPIAVQELALAGWLIVRGFTPSSIRTGAAIHPLSAI